MPTIFSLNKLIICMSFDLLIHVNSFTTEQLNDNNDDFICFAIISTLCWALTRTVRIGGRQLQQCIMPGLTLPHAADHGSQAGTARLSALHMLDFCAIL